MRIAPLAGFLLLVPALAALAGPGALDLAYEDASEGLPEGRPGTENDAGWTGVRFADVNGDGWLDLGAIGRKGNGTQVYLGHGDGTWTRSMHGMTPYFSGRSDLRFGDLDGDGNLDVVDSNARVWLGDGTGAWRPGPQNLPASGEDVALGDVDNDGDLDAAVMGHLCCGIKVFRNDGTARWTASSSGLPTANGGHKLDFHDLDLDGCLDLVAAHWYDGGAWFGDCAGNWRPATAGLKGFQGWDVEAGDVDGDGLADVVFSTLHGQDGPEGIRVFLGDGAGNWTARPILLGDEPWGGIALEDVDGDGALDLFAGRNGFSGSTGRAVLLLGDGAGGFTPLEAGLPQAVDKVEGLGAGDLDHSGVWDVALALYGDDGVQAWREQGQAQDLGVRVLEPRGGELWVGGGLRHIRWASAVPPGDGPGAVDLAYSTTGPGGPWVPIATGIPNGASYAWRVADAQSANAHVRVTVHAGGASASATHPLPFGLNAGPSAGPRVHVAARASPAQLAPLDAEALQGEVRNDGFARVTGTLRLALSRAGTALLEAERGVDLPDRGRALLDASWLAGLADRPGGYAVRATFEGRGETPQGDVAVGRGASAAFTVVRPWLEASANLTPAAAPGQPFRLGVTLANTGNLPAQDVAWTLALPWAYAPVPEPNRVLREAGKGLPRVVPALFGEPPPANVSLDPENRTWVLTWRFPGIAAGASAGMRLDLVPALPGDHALRGHADYAHHYAHRAGPTAFALDAAWAQRVALPAPVPVPPPPG